MRNGVTKPCINVMFAGAALVADSRGAGIRSTQGCGCDLMSSHVGSVLVLNLYLLEKSVSANL
jgi:hypothetical protein